MSQLPGASRNREDVQQGILLMVVAMLLLPGIDAIAKGVSDHVGAGQVTWSRFLFQTLLLLPFALMGGGLKVGKRLWVHAARGFLIALATVLFFTSLKKMPLADAISIFFIEPFILTMMSVVFLGEKVGWRRLLALMAGFGGALIIIRPSYEVFGMTALLPVGAAFTFALYMVLSRMLVVGGSIVTMQFYAGVFGFLTMSVALWVGYEIQFPVLTPVIPTLAEWMLLAGLGAIATGGHMLIVLAIRRVGASMVAPFQYLEIISATILGLVFFGDFPSSTTWIGVTIIIASGLYVFYRERRLAGELDALSPLKT